MRLFSAILFALSSIVLLTACQALDQLGGNGGDAGATAAADAGAAAEAGIQGAGCGIEQKAGVELCAATSKCPTLVVDTQSMPSCGFRINGSAVDLVCACGTALCPMGSFVTCAEATQLLANQTESSVCVQVSEGRCTEGAGAASASSSSGANTGNKICDRQCMKECGGGAGCASVCNCD